MRHRIAARKLGRTTSHRLAMLRNMVTSLFIHERITTTDAKAKEVRKVAEWMITLGKRGDLHARRQAAAVVRGKEANKKLFTELAQRYKDMAGGYTRIVKLGPRRGDGAMMSLIELVTPQIKSPAKKASKRASKRQPSKEKAQSSGSKGKEGEASQ
jgi:large subunit ribosomal protein L17